MKRRWLLVCLVVVAPSALGGCELLEDVVENIRNHAPGGDPPRACTEIGCSDQLNVTIRPRAGVFPSGMHEVVIAAEGSPVRRCTFNFPIAGGPGAVESGACNSGDGLFLTVAPVMECTTMTSGNAASQTCTPVPGKFEERLHIPGTSPQVRVTQRTIAGGKYLDQEIAPTYAPAYPNGPECGPVCKQASTDWEF